MTKNADQILSDKDNKLFKNIIVNGSLLEILDYCDLEKSLQDLENPIIKILIQNSLNIKNSDFGEEQKINLINEYSKIFEEGKRRGFCYDFIDENNIEIDTIFHYLASKRTKTNLDLLKDLFSNQTIQEGFNYKIQDRSLNTVPHLLLQNKSIESLLLFMEFLQYSRFTDNFIFQIRNQNKESIIDILLNLANFEDGEIEIGKLSKDCFEALLFNNRLITKNKFLSEYVTLEEENKVIYQGKVFDEIALLNDQETILGLLEKALNSENKKIYFSNEGLFSRNLVLNLLKNQRINTVILLEKLLLQEVVQDCDIFDEDLEEVIVYLANKIENRDCFNLLKNICSIPKLREKITRNHLIKLNEVFSEISGENVKQVLDEFKTFFRSTVYSINIFGGNLSKNINRNLNDFSVEFFKNLVEYHGYYRDLESRIAELESKFPANKKINEIGNFIRSSKAEKLPEIEKNFETNFAAILHFLPNLTEDFIESNTKDENGENGIVQLPEEVNLEVLKDLKDDKKDFFALKRFFEKKSVQRLVVNLIEEGDKSKLTEVFLKVNFSTLSIQKDFLNKNLKFLDLKSDYKSILLECFNDALTEISEAKDDNQDLIAYLNELGFGIEFECNNYPDLKMNSERFELYADCYKNGIDGLDVRRIDEMIERVDRKIKENEDLKANLYSVGFDIEDYEYMTCSDITNANVRLSLYLDCYKNGIDGLDLQEIDKMIERVDEKIKENEDLKVKLEKFGFIAEKTPSTCNELSSQNILLAENLELLEKGENKRSKEELEDRSPSTSIEVTEHKNKRIKNERF